MLTKSVKLRILIWFELVLAARILLFTVPVLLNKQFNGGPLVGYEAKFINILTLAALFYLGAAISALMGVKQWKLLHYGVAIGVCVLSFPFLNAAGRLPDANYYLIPAVFSVLLSLGLLSSRGRTV